MVQYLELDVIFQAGSKQLEGLSAETLQSCIGHKVILTSQTHKPLCSAFGLLCLMSVPYMLWVLHLGSERSFQFS